MSFLMLDKVNEAGKTKKKANRKLQVLASVVTANVYSYNAQNSAEF